MTVNAVSCSKLLMSPFFFISGKSIWIIEQRLLDPTWIEEDALLLERVAGLTLYLQVVNRCPGA